MSDISRDISRARDLFQEYSYTIFLYSLVHIFDTRARAYASVRN